MIHSTPTIGIWGFGKVGAATARYYLRNNIRPGIIDAQPLTPEQLAWCAENNLRVWQPEQLLLFLEYYDQILPSPGIDLRAYQLYHHKWIAEFDVFCTNYKQPIIGITGSIGKTSITHLLSELLRVSGAHVATGGNIGIGMLDLLTIPDTTQALLELSSFQLDLVRTGAPDLAIITNLYPNHLDRHGTLDEYARAKAKIYAHQTAEQTTLMPYELAYGALANQLPCSQLYLFSEAKPDMTHLPATCRGVFFIDAMTLILAHATGEQPLITLAGLPLLTFTQNWLIIASAAYMLGIDLHLLLEAAHTFSLPPHRLERVAHINGVTFYNDSKATTSASMLAAVTTVAVHAPIHLFIGGLGKGVDREPAIAQLRTTVAHAYCFGAEAELVHKLCLKHGIASSAHPTLEDAFAACLTQAKPGQTVLLSPGGSSYDLFTDYEHRGTQFKHLVQEHQRSKPAI